MRSAVPLGDPGFGKAVPCTCQEEIGASRLRHLQRYSNLGPLTRLTFERLRPEGRGEDAQSRRLFQAGYEAARGFAEDPQGFLVLTGPSGCGKTHLAAALANRALALGHPAFFMTVPDLLDHLRATFAPTSEVPYDELFDQVRNASLLVLDDLGVHSGTPWAEEKLYQILNHRYNARLPTVVVLSVPLERLEDRLRSRLTDPGLSQVLPLRHGPAAPLEDMGRPEPQLLARMTFANFDPRGNRGKSVAQEQRDTLTYALKSARHFAEAPEGWLVLVGDTGVGKTHLAVAIAGERLKVGEEVAFTFVPDLLDHLRFTFSPESPVTYDRLFEWVKSAPLLILDDLGGHRTSPWAEEKLYQIVVHRHNARLPTVITTRKLRDDPQDPVASRLKDPSLVNVVAIDAPDYREQEQGTPRPRPPGRRPGRG